MNKIISITILLIVNILSVFAQPTAVINTKRDFPMGVVSFGASVLSGAMGDDSFIDGYIKKSGSELFIFPVGDDAALRPFAALGNETTGAYFGVDPNSAVTSNPMGGNFGVLPLGGPFNTTIFGSEVKKVSAKEYWDINGGTATPITLTWDANSDINTITEGKGLSKLTIVGWDGSKWVKIPSRYDEASILGGASDLSSGSITTNAAVTPDTYNVYTLAGLTDGALPVTLVSFNVSRVEQAVSLDWITSTETNSSHFNIERSADGKAWLTLGSVVSKSFFADSSSSSLAYDFRDGSPLAGNNYYRLKMVDKDETFAYSTIRHIALGMGKELVAYPNPVSQRLFLSGYDPEAVLEARLWHITGKSILCPTNTLQEGIDVSRIPAGSYVLSLTLANGQSQSYKVLVKN